MSSASVTNDFTNGLIGDADEIDQNFSDIVNFLNTHVVHKGETALEAKTGSPGLKLQVGSDAISITTSGTQWSKATVFPVAFTTVPRVWVQNGLGGGGAKKYTLMVDDPATTTGFTTFAATTDLSTPSGSITLDFYYLAIGT
jgi:hypothetical protein